MNKPLDTAARRRRRQRADAAGALGARLPRAGIGDRPRRRSTSPASRSQPLYSAARLGRPTAGAEPLGFPGQPDYTRGIYATMHRGRTWTQRQLIGLGTPADYNARLLGHPGARRDRRLADPVQLGLPRLRHGRGRARAARHLRRRRQQRRPHGRAASTASTSARISCALNDPSPFTLLAFMLVAAERRGVDWERDHRHLEPERLHLALRRQPHVLPARAAGRAPRAGATTSPSATSSVPRWNPMSVVGQHMQQAGATPAEAMAFTLATAVQNAEDCIARGMDPDEFLPRFTFFFDISISFFEEIAKFRAGRRIWARIARERLGAKDPRVLALQVPRPDLGRRPDAPAAAQQHRPRHGAGDGRHLRRPAVAAHRRLRRGASRCPTRGRRAHRRRDAEHPARGGAPHRRDRPARRLVLRRVADRRRWRRRSCAIMQTDRRRRRHVQGGRVGPGAAHDRRLGAALPAAASSRGEQTIVGVNAYRPTRTRRRGRRSSGPTPTTMQAPPRRASRAWKAGALGGGGRHAALDAPDPRRRRPATATSSRAVVDGAPRPACTQRGDLRAACAATSASASRSPSSDGVSADARAARSPSAALGRRPRARSRAC